MPPSLKDHASTSSEAPLSRPCSPSLPYLPQTCLEPRSAHIAEHAGSRSSCLLSLDTRTVRLGHLPPLSPAQSCPIPLGILLQHWVLGDW